MGQPELHSRLTNLLGPDSVTAYNQPPSSVAMQYPCILYVRDDLDVKKANNRNYSSKWRWQLIVMDYDPESVLIDAVKELEYCTFVRHYEVDGLHHDVFQLFF